MKRLPSFLALVFLAVVLMTGCRQTNDPILPDNSTSAAGLVTSSSSDDDDDGGDRCKGRVRLCGVREVPPVATDGRGKFKFQLNEDGELEFTLSAKHMNSNVTQSHIHLAGCGVNGGVVAFLFGPFFPNGVEADGKLAKGTITDANLVGALAGKTIADLCAAIDAGNAYVNVHTTTSPGGEIRGQLGNPDCLCEDGEDDDDEIAGAVDPSGDAD